jgi:high-affinity nickel-transport protein
VALIIGGIELISIITERFGITTGVLAAIGSLDLNYVGYAIVALFVVTWLIAVAVWRVARIEDRWTTDLRTTPAE